MMQRNTPSNSGVILTPGLGRSLYSGGSRFQLVSFTPKPTLCSRYLLTSGIYFPFDSQLGMWLYFSASVSAENSLVTKFQFVVWRWKAHVGNSQVMSLIAFGSGCICERQLKPLDEG